MTSTTSLSLIGVTLTGKDRGGASGHGRWGCCPSAEGAPSKLESILRSKTSQKNNSRKVYIREFKTAQDMIFASKQVSFVVLLKYWIFNVPFCRTFVHFLRCNMPKSPRNFPKSSWSHGRWSLCLKDREKISYKDEETYYKLCTADSVPVKVLWFARYGWQTNSELKNCNVMYDEVNLLKRLRLFSWLQILKSPMWHWDNGFWYIMKMKKMKMQRCNVTMSPLGSCDFSGCRGASAIERRTSDGGATGAIRSPCVMLRETLMRTPQGFDCGI